jgi:hypothetical protein
MTSFSNKCRKCKIRQQVTDTNGTINFDVHFILCKECYNSSKLYSKTFCLNQLALSKSDISPLKYLYTDNKDVKYYLDDDIENIVKTKFDKIQKNKLKRIEKARHLALVQQERKDNLIRHLADHKLEYKRYGDCYTYVTYGYPDIELVIQNEIDKATKLSNRKYLLYNELQKFGISYSESNDSICYEFANEITDKSLDDVISDAKIEDFFIKFTNYLELRKIYTDDETAKEKALNSYMEKTDESNRHEIANDIINKVFVVNID